MNFKEIQKIDWQKIVGRKADLQKAIQFSCNRAGGFGKFFEIGDVERQLYFFDGRTTSLYFSEKDYNYFLKKVYKKLEDTNFLKKSEKEIIKICEKCIEDSKSAIRKIESKNKQNDLLDVLRKFNDIWDRFYPIGWLFFFVTDHDHVIEKKLKKLGFKKEEIKEIIEIASYPHKVVPVMEMEKDIVRLAKKLNKKSKDIKDYSIFLSKKFGWMSVYNTEDKENGSAYYLKEARKVMSKRENVDLKIKKNNLKFNLILSKIKDETLKEQLKFFHASGYLRDKREETRDRVTIIQKKLYSRIAKLSGLSLNEIVYLTDEEIERLLLNPSQKVKIKKIARSRLSSYMFLVNHGEIVFIKSKKEIDRIARFLEEKKRVNKFSGQTASTGKDSKIIGSAKVVLNNGELNKVKKDDILIATMTKPNYVLAMKKAAAIITDEGGVTCHAAIVAREMKKPCIIATKIATKVLHDGDEVEVDADKGIVKIIKRYGKK